MSRFFPTLSGEYLPTPQEDGEPRFFYRRAHWVRNANHPATAAGGVGALPMPPDMMPHEARGGAPAPVAAPALAAAQAPAVPLRPADAATQTNLFGDQSAEDRYELLLRFQAASDDFYSQKREQIFAQLTPAHQATRCTAPSTSKRRRILKTTTLVCKRSHANLSSRYRFQKFNTITHQSTGIFECHHPTDIFEYHHPTLVFLNTATQLVFLNTSLFMRPQFSRKNKKKWVAFFPQFLRY